MAEEQEKQEKPAEKPKTRERGYSYCLWLLGAREYSRIKLGAKLKEKGYEEFRESILDELVEKGYLREAAFAEARVRGWIRKGYAESHILRRARMEKFEITVERVRELYQELGVDEASQVRSLLKKRLKRGRPEPKDYAGRRKLAAAAARKGHNFGLIATEIESELENREE